jgi:hypothetical protein
VHNFLAICSLLWTGGKPLVGWDNADTNEPRQVNVIWNGEYDKGNNVPSRVYFTGLRNKIVD